MYPLICFPRYHCFQCDAKSLIYDITSKQYKCTDCGLDIDENIIESIIEQFKFFKNNITYARFYLNVQCIACGCSDSLYFSKFKSNSIYVRCDKCKIKLEMSDLLETNCIRYKTILIDSCWIKQWL